MKKINNAKKGASLVEYSMIAGLVSVLTITAVLSLGTETRGTFATADETLALFQDPDFVGPRVPETGLPVTVPPATNPPISEPEEEEKTGREYDFGRGVWLSVGTHVLTDFPQETYARAVGFGPSSLGGEGDTLDGSSLVGVSRTRFGEPFEDLEAFVFFSAARPGVGFVVPSYMGVPPLGGQFSLSVPTPRQGSVSFDELEELGWTWAEARS